VQQDPAYLRKQSRHLHALYRRNQRFLNVSVLLWMALFATLAAIALIDRVAVLNWGYASDMWAFAGFTASGPCFWAFATLVAKLNLAYVRHTYGPDPTE
jgi:hypothetical protein